MGFDRNSMSTFVVKPYLPSLAKYQQYTSEIFGRGQLTNSGPLLRELEIRLQEYLEVKHVICVSNCTLGLQVLYKALGLKGKVITTPFSFIATRSSLEWEGLTPIFSDIDDASWNLSPAKIQSDALSDASAILGVHVYGNPCEVTALERAAKDRGIPLIYDAAHAFGIKVNGQSVLTSGTGSVLSFHATKLFHTVEGGAIIVSDDRLANDIRKLISFGSVDKEEQKVFGINAKLSELHAAMGLAVLDDIDLILSRRRDLYQHYVEKLSGRFQTQKIRQGTTYNFAYFPILLDSAEMTERCIEALQSESIHPRRYFYPSLEVLCSDQKIECPTALEISKCILCLPLYPDLELSTVEKICKILIEVCS
jgi:dTDP-4-amino-4,6-dideoxygalactose transaminase